MILERITVNLSIEDAVTLKKVREYYKSMGIKLSQSEIMCIALRQELKRIKQND